MKGIVDLELRALVEVYVAAARAGGKDFPCNRPRDAPAAEKNLLRSPFLPRGE